MNDIVTAATKVAKRLRDDQEDPSPSEIASAVDEATDQSQNQNPSALEQYAKKAALIGAVALARRYLSDDQSEGIDEDATRVEVVDPDEREASSTRSTSESEESSGGLFSLKRLAFLGVVAGAGYVAVKKLRSKGEQHTLEEWDEPSATADETEGTSEDVSDHDVDIGAGQAEDDESESSTTTDVSDVADGEPVDADDNEAADVEDNEAIGVDDDTVAADPGEVAVEEDVAEEAGADEDEDEDEDERVSQSE